MLYSVDCSPLRTGQLINAIYLYFPSTEAFLYTTLGPLSLLIPGIYDSTGT